MEKVKFRKIGFSALAVVLSILSCKESRKIKGVQIEEQAPTTEERKIDEEEKFVKETQSLEMDLFENAKAYVLNDTIKKKGRIINGEFAMKGEIPWQVAIIVEGSKPSRGQFCGGSIVNSKWILTAAHCLEGNLPEDIQIFSGSRNLNSGGNVLNVKQIIIHPDYDNYNLDNDVALIELEKPIIPNEDQNIVFLPTEDKTQKLLEEGLDATVSGWGVTETGKPSKRLKKVVIEMISKENCTKSYGDEVTSNMVCAGYTEGKKDACQGDSGGPLVVNTAEGIPFLVGIVSWGRGCGEPNLFGVYTKVHNYLNWININCGCLQLEPAI